MFDCLSCILINFKNVCLYHSWMRRQASCLVLMLSWPRLRLSESERGHTDCQTNLPWHHCDRVYHMISPEVIKLLTDFAIRVASPGSVFESC